MKRVILVCLVLSLVLTCGVAIAGNGNNLPPGPRYMLNVIAYDNCPNGDFTNSNRHMIAVQASYSLDQNGNPAASLVKTNTIKLTAGPEDEFQVIDGNACNKGGAEFMLPLNPYKCDTEIVNDPDCIGEDLTFQEYNVYVRLVGKPKTGIDVTTCAIDPVVPEDPNDDIIVCSTESVVKVRMTGKGKMVFDDVTRQLTTLCLDTDSNGSCDTRVPLFSGDYYDYFWQWNTEGKAHAQLVFIPIPD